jgi:hypothetical protein
VSSWSRYLAGAVGSAFGLVWMTAGLGAAIVSLLLGALAYGSVVVAERARAGATTRRSLTLDLRRDYEAPAEDAPLVGEVEYGWPSATAG